MVLHGPPQSSPPTFSRLAPPPICPSPAVPTTRHTHPFEHTPLRTRCDWAPDRIISLTLSFNVYQISEYRYRTHAMQSYSVDVLPSRSPTQCDAHRISVIPILRSASPLFLFVLQSFLFKYLLCLGRGYTRRGRAAVNPPCGGLCVSPCPSIDLHPRSSKDSPLFDFLRAPSVPCRQHAASSQDNDVRRPRPATSRGTRGSVYLWS
jgi:hypothetical protein